MAYQRSRIPHLTEKMKAAQIKLIKDKLLRTVEDWKQVLWSDECMFQLFPPGNRACDSVWAQDSGSVEPVTTVEHPLQVMAWAMFSFHAMSGLHFVPEKQTVDGDYYREEILKKTALSIVNRMRNTGTILETKRLPNTSSAIFMQDSARPHTTIANQKWLSDHFARYWRKDEWPRNSPNLNPI